MDHPKSVEVLKVHKVDGPPKEGENSFKSTRVDGSPKERGGSKSPQSGWTPKEGENPFKSTKVDRSPKEGGGS